MQSHFYRGDKPNFGDELNPWMWPQLLDGVWDTEDNSIFVGIGSIIHNRYPSEKTKIVFGAGYGGYAPLPTIDPSWKFYFVRGKLTAKALGIDEKYAIGDSAILLRSLINHKVTKRYKVSFMPHWQSTHEGNWELACKYGSINYLDPTAPVEETIEQILASELVITEAMHGAIVSDALRVPWIPLQPQSDIHSMKWYDWASALEINLKPYPFVTSSLLESITLFFDDINKDIAQKLRRRGKALLKVCPEVFAQRAAKNLIEISWNTPTLSSDSAIESAHEKMLAKLSDLVVDLGRGKVTLK